MGSIYDLYVTAVMDMLYKYGNDFKKEFNEEFGGLTKKEITPTLQTIIGRIEESKNGIETTLNKMFETHNKDTKIYLTQEEYDEYKGFIKNINKYNIVVGEILDFEKKEDKNKFTLRKQIFWFECSLEKYNNQLDIVNEVLNEKEDDLEIGR